MILLVGIIAAGSAAALLGYYLLSRAPQGCACGRCRDIDDLRCRLSREKPTAWLEFRSGPMQGQILQLTERVTRLGSVGPAEIVLSDPAVSQEHLRIERKQDGFTLRDLGSTNGVYVNAIRESRIVLAADDLIRVGNSELVLRFR